MHNVGKPVSTSERRLAQEANVRLSENQSLWVESVTVGNDIKQCANKVIVKLLPEKITKLFP